MITKNDIEKLTAEVAEKSVKTVYGSNIKIQNGIISTNGTTAGLEYNFEFDEPFDEPPVIILTTIRPGTFTNYYARLMTRTAEGFTMVCFGSSPNPYQISVMWLAIGTKI